MTWMRDPLSSSACASCATVSQASTSSLLQIRMSTAVMLSDVLGIWQSVVGGIMLHGSGEMCAMQHGNLTKSIHDKGHEESMHANYNF